VLVNLQCEKPSSYSISIFVISLFGCPLALDARGRRPVRPPSARHCIYNRVNGDAAIDGRGERNQKRLSTGQRRANSMWT